MTPDDIIRMAIEAGFEEYNLTSLSGDSELDRTLQVGEYPVGESVFKLVNLVATAEREACAKLCELEVVHDTYDTELKMAKYIAKAIRARGNNDV